MSKLKILQFPIANSFGGITHYALNNWKWIDKGRFQCDFATMSKHLDFEGEILRTGSKIHYISCYAEEDLERFKYEVRKILEQGYDIVHLHTKQWKSFVMEELCVECGVPRIIVHSHSTGIDTIDPQKRVWETKLHEETKRKFNMSLATDFWACSQMAADFLFGEQIPKEKIKIMKNSIDVEKFAYDKRIRENYRRKYGLENKFVIGNVARFAYQKNHDFLIDMYCELVKQIIDSKLILIGDGELEKDIREKVQKLNLSDNVLFLGKREDINNWYQAMDIFCLPSRFEGMPISVVEAQASGLHCVISDRITQEVNIEGHVEYLSINESYPWVHAIEKVAERPDERYPIDNLKREYSNQKCIEKIESAYLSGV